MGSQVGFAPDALYGVLAHAEVGGEAAARPVCGPLRGGRRVAASTGARTRAVNFHGAPPRVPARQALNAFLEERPAPLGDGRAADIELGGYGSNRHAVGEEQHDLGALYELGGECARAGKLLEVLALCVGQMNQLSFKGIHRDDDSDTANVWLS